MVFKGKQKGKAPDLNIKIGDQPEKRVNNTKFLGVIIDAKISWKPTYTKWNAKCPSALGF